MIGWIRKTFTRRPVTPTEFASPTEREITPFFANIHEYVALAEDLPLEQLRGVMNAYFEACMDEIVTSQGAIDKIVGDGVVAMFGAPLELRDHATRACEAALRCQQRIQELRARWQREGDHWPQRVRQLRVRIGLHSGRALVGAFGSVGRFSYTMMGDNVNLAARLEALAKLLGTRILCTGATRAASEFHAPGRILFRPLGEFVVQEGTEAVELFEPVALRDEMSDQLRECVQAFAAGLSKQGAGDFSAAIDFFGKSARLEADQMGGSLVSPANPSAWFLEKAKAARK